MPLFGDRDVRSIAVADVQALLDQFLDTGRPRSVRTIELVMRTLGMVLAHAGRLGHVDQNAFNAWKEGRPRRRRSAVQVVTREHVLSAEELDRLLGIVARDDPAHFPFVLFLADTGARLGEATAVRWIDVDLDRGLVRIERSYSMGRDLGPTKTGRARHVEISTRLRETLAATRPELFGDEALVFPSSAGTFLDQSNFRDRVFRRAVEKALGRDRRFTPHGLRHTFASLHLSRGTNLLWVQQQGGWTSPAVLLSTYAHFLPAEVHGFADTLSTSPDGTRRHQPIVLSEGSRGRTPTSRAPTRVYEVGPPGIEPGTDGLKVHCSAS